MTVDILYNHGHTKKLVDEKGWKALMEKLEEDFPERKLYSVSNDWYEDQTYILKAKGAYGDVIVGWLEWELEERR